MFSTTKIVLSAALVVSTTFTASAATKPRRSRTSDVRHSSWSFGAVTGTRTGLYNGSDNGPGAEPTPNGRIASRVRYRRRGPRAAADRATWRQVSCLRHSHTLQHSPAKSFQNKGNPIAASVAVHSATITVKPPNTTAITLVSSGIISRY
jgi:hypothetical protein